jgi:hypothetical protein
MQDATVERLTKIIAEPRQSDDKSGKKGPFRRPSIQFHIGLAEGWFSLFLLAVVVYSTIWCVQAAGWVDHLNILTLTTAIGLIAGVVAAKQQRLSRFLVHALAVLFALLLAIWQTTSADYAGNFDAFFASIHTWILLALAGGTSSDDSIFLFLIIALSFLLAYTSAWLVYRTRNPWLMILANAVVLLINLSYIEPGYIVFLVVFLVASLLLLLRVNLYESSVRWKKLGLRCADDLGWEFMQAGALISIAILVISWLIPWGYTNQAAAQIWSADNNPWVEIQNTWNRLVSVSGGYNPANHGNFTDTLTLGGNPNLTNVVVLTMKTDDDTQYLESLSYDTYTGRGWIIGPTYSTSYKANDFDYDQTQYAGLRAVHQNISIVNPPGEQKAYILGAPQIVSTDQNAQIVSSNANDSVVSWLRTNGKLAAGNSYSVTSYVSAADIKTLESVPLPANAPTYPPNFDGQRSINYYDPNILRTYLQLPAGLDPRIYQVAKQQTASATNMYDKAVALESYLRSFTYDVNVSLPPGAEGTSWLLFQSGHRAYCNYFATAMAVMARELGMPARVVAGYTHGTLDPKTKEMVVRGTDAHLWTQIYFAGYGWINFEPSPSFSTFARPLTSSNGNVTVTPGGPASGGKNGSHGRVGLPNETGNTSTGISTTPGQQQAQIRQDIGLALFAIVILILLGLLYFSFWWRRLFHGLALSSQVYGRLCLLANWAGISLSRSQTPYEYVHALAEVAPDQAVTLERLGDIYVRDRWADPASEEHPRRSGEIGELSVLWKRLQPRLFIYVLRHPHFLRWLPERLGRVISQRRHRRRVQDILDEDI